MLNMKVDSQIPAVIPIISFTCCCALIVAAWLTVGVGGRDGGSYSSEASVADDYLQVAYVDNGTDAANVIESDLVRMTPKFAYPSRVRNAALRKRQIMTGRASAQRAAGRHIRV